MSSSDESRSTKYEIPDDHEWADVEEAWEDIQDTTYLDNHVVEVVHVYGEDRMWDKRKYEVHITHDDEGATALHAVPHRWKGNYWREASDFDDWLDWHDLPYLVRRRVAQLVDCEGREDLAPEHRVVHPEGGEASAE